MTKTRIVGGLTMVQSKKTKATKLMESRIKVRATKDERGMTISFADEKNGFMLIIPVEPVSDFIEVKE